MTAHNPTAILSRVTETFQAAGGVKLEKWLDGIGVARSTGTRWINQGMLSPVNILGNYYITREMDADFWRYAAAGQFAVRRDKQPETTT